MTPLTAFTHLLVAVFIGILIGLDRERTEDRKAHHLFAGVRTFPLIALAGAIPMLLIDVAGPALLIASFICVGAVIAVSYIRASAAGNVGTTTEMAALATFLLGALAGAGQLHIAAGAGIGVATLLAAKISLESFSRALTQEEFSSALELAVISVIILPLLPHQGYGPWGVLNPFEIWLIVVLVSALSFVGFIAARLFGERSGILATGAMGALVSSTVVTVAMAAESRANKQSQIIAAAAVMLASAIMCPRAAVLAGAVDLDVLAPLAVVLIAMTVASAIGAWVLARQTTREPMTASSTTIRNPFSLRGALTFGFIYAVVLVVSRGAREYFGTAGLYAAAVLSSIANVDAVTIIYSRMAADGGDLRVAANAIAIGLVTNTITKIVIAVTMGQGRFRNDVALALGAVAVVGVIAVLGVAWF